MQSVFPITVTLAFRKLKKNNVVSKPILEPKSYDNNVFVSVM